MVAQHEGSELGGQREDDVEIVGVEQTLQASIDPLFLRAPLTPWAVSISARVVRVADVSAVPTEVGVTAELSGSTMTDGAEHFRPGRREPLRVDVAVVEGHPKNVSDLESRTLGFFGRWSSTSRGVVRHELSELVSFFGRRVERTLHRSDAAFAHLRVAGRALDRYMSEQKLNLTGVSSKVEQMCRKAVA